MRIESLSLKGLLRFSDRVDLSLRDVPPGLIAIVGENGSGKTTLLEAMVAAVYRQLPSRGDVLPYATGRDSFIDLEASVEGRGTYRSRLSMDKVARKSDAVLELVGADGARRVLNDGKVSTFDAVVAETFPPLPVLLASAFAAQNREGSFVKLDRKARQQLFAALLGLAHYEQMAQTARTAGSLIDRRLAEQLALVAHLRPITTDAQADELGATGNRLQVELSQSDAALEHAALQITEREQSVAELRAGAARYLAAAGELRIAADRQTRLEADRQQLPVERAAVEQEAAEGERAIARRHDLAVGAARGAIAALETPELLAQRLEAKRTAILTACDTKVAEKRERIRRNDELLEQADEVRKAVADRVEIFERVEAARAAWVSVNEDVIALREQLRVAEVNEAELRGAVAELATARQAAGLLDRVPCGGAGDYAGCELLASARAQHDRIAALATRVQEHHAAQQAAADLRGSIDLGTGLVHDRANDVARETAAAEALAPMAAKLEHLEAAKARVADHEADIETFTREAAAMVRDAEAQHQAALEAVAHARQRHEDAITDVAKDAEQERAELAARLTVRRAAIDAREAELSRQAVDLAQLVESLTAVRDANAEAHTCLVMEEGTLRLARDHAAGLAAIRARLDAEIEAFERRRAEFRNRQAQRERLEVEVERMQADLIDWQALAKVLGRDGLPVLEIDAAGPGVSALANDLLEACFGGRFQVELVTQEAKADGKGMKDSFELKVYDAERGGDARDVADLSGGEQVLVDEALKSAIALFVNQRNVLPIRTFWRDETTGALDPENAVRYVAMLRRVHARGGFHHGIFITHNSEAAALADAQIVVGDRVAIVYPPFGRPEAA